MKKSKKRRLRFTGTDRGYMMLSKDVRRRWLQYGSNRNIPMEECTYCKSKTELEVDHIHPVGERPYSPEAFGPYIKKMFENECQSLCKKCNRKKRDKEQTND